MPLLEIRGVGKSFGRLRALHDVSFALERDEIVGLIGPNGAGKSTLVDIVSGRTPPSAGAVFLEGVSLVGRPAHRIARAGVARTFQVAEPLRGATVLEAVMVGALNARAERRPTMREAEAAARASLTFTGLLERRAEQTEALDVTARKRLAVAQALATNPRLIMLDEIMAGLPSPEIDAFVALVRRIRERGIAVVVIEHVIAAIRALAGRIIVLHHGEKIADAAPAQIFRDAAVLAAYLGPRFRENRP